LKSIIKDKKRVILFCIVNIVICVSSPASKGQKTPAKPSYSLVGDLHGMQGGSGSSPLGSTFFIHGNLFHVRFCKDIIFVPIFKSNSEMVLVHQYYAALKI